MKTFIYLLIFNFIMSIDYNTQIQPIFDANCTSCHIGNFASGDLQLDTYENLMNGADGEMVIVPGDHQNSILWQVIDSGEMPGYPNDDLDQPLIDLIAEWIDAGALECEIDEDEDGICDDVDDCVGEYDECGVCNGDGITDGACDCEGNVLDDCNVCGGTGIPDGFSVYTEIETLYPNVTIQDDGTCFKNSDLQTLTDIIEINDFDNSMNAFELGTQTWNDGRLRFLVAGYYFSGVEIPIHTLPESIGNLDDLRKLYLEENNITSLPDSFSNLTALVQLYISFNQLTELPENFGNLDNLYILDLGYNSINNLPDSFLDLSSLTYLWLFNNELSSLPENFCSLDLNWSDDDYFGYPYFAIGGNMLCEDIPDCVENSEHFEISLDTYYYSVQINECQNCVCGDGICNGCEDEEECPSDCLLNNNDFTNDIIFEISNVYPNPFNPIINIEFTVSQSDYVTVSIYDLNGKNIEQLMNNEFISAGSYNIKWSGENFSSGVYFVKISNSMESKNQKIILQK